jgi:hypothetical protein
LIQVEKQKTKNKNDPEIKTSENNIFESEDQDNNGIQFGSFKRSSKSTHAENPKEHEIVAPEVREDTNIVNSIKTAQKESEQWAVAEREVELWQSQNGIKLRQGAKEIACLAAYIHNTEKRGLLRTDLEKVGYTPNYARRILYRFQEKKVLKPIDGRRRVGRLQEYFLTTKIDQYIDNMDDLEKTAKYNVKQREKEEEDIFSFIQYLISYLSAQRPTFHKLVLQTQIPKDYYNILGRHWIVEDALNKTKVTDYGLDFRRSAMVKVSPNGTVMIHLESTYNPYHLHKPEGLVDFFGACGTVLSRLKIDCKDSIGGVRPISEWYLKQHDFDKTIPISALEEKIPHIRRWWSREGIQLKYLGKVFQIYGKAMPIDGKTIRFEGSISTKENIQLAQGITEAIQPELKYETALELHKQQNRSQMELIQERLKKLEERIP